MTKELDKLWEDFYRDIGFGRYPLDWREAVDQLTVCLESLAWFVREAIKPLEDFEVIGWREIANILQKSERTVKGYKKELEERNIITYKNTGKGRPQPVIPLVKLLFFKVAKEKQAK
jgi:hypothetical protein